LKNTTNYSLSLLDCLQTYLARKVEFKDKLRVINSVGGCDVYYHNDYAYCCVCILSFRKLYLIKKIIIKVKISFPYLTGYFCFREGPPILKAISKLTEKPDCFLIDGNGILHPRGMGLANFIGIFTKSPTIGCAKSLLLGHYKEPDSFKGSSSCIRYKKRTIGLALRTKDNVKEVFISVGWGISLTKAKEVVLKTSRYRIPEPLRLAHYFAKTLKK